MILECQGVCRANMGIILKLLCPGDVPAKAHKLILNTTTAAGYEEYCHENYHAKLVYNLWQYDYQGFPLVDNTTNEMIEHPWPARIWGEYDRMISDWEIILRKLLFEHCIQ